MKSKKIFVLCSFLVIFLLIILIPIIARASITGGALGSVNIEVGHFKIIIDYPNTNKTYILNNSNINVNVTLDMAGQDASWCGLSLNGASNITMSNTSNRWSKNLNISNFGLQNTTVYCNNTLGTVYLNSTRFYAQNSTIIKNSIIPQSDIPVGETIEDYIKTENVFQETYTREFEGQNVMTYDDGRFVELQVTDFNFTYYTANITSAKYEKAPPNVTDIRTITSYNLLKYVDIKVLGLISGVVDINISYANSEISGYDESTLTVYRETAGKNWTMANITARYQEDNKIGIRENVTVLNETALAIVGQAVSAPSVLTGGGGGGAPQAIIPEKKIVKEIKFFVDTNFLKFSLVQGETKSKTIEITNEGDDEANFSLSVEKIDKYIFPSAISFTLKPKESKKISINAVAYEDIIPDVYTGYIKIISGSAEEIVNVVIEASSRKAMFDVLVEIPEDYKSILAGDSVGAAIKLFNLGGTKTDVALKYGIKTMQNAVLLENSETLAVETKVEVFRSFKTTLKQDAYIFYAVAAYDNITATGSDVFEVKEKEPDILLAIVISGFIVIIFIILALDYFRSKKLERILEKVGKVEPEDLLTEEAFEG